jgi:inosine/xanthosine triphosphate pyrophosphatase family protein
VRARVKLFLASSNPGKLGEFRALAADVPTVFAEIELMPGFDSLPSFEEDSPTFAETRREKLCTIRDLEKDL